MATSIPTSRACSIARTLPVKAQAFAGRCSPIEGVYPIGVQSSNLDQHGFLPPQNPADLPFYKIRLKI